MVKTRSKGRRTLNRAILKLTEDGYTVGECEKGGMFTKVKDMFGLYDLVAVQKGFNPLFVQVKTNTPAKKKPLQNFSEQHDIYGLCMTWYDKPGKPRGWVHHCYGPTGNFVKYDYRK